MLVTISGELIEMRSPVLDTSMRRHGRTANPPSMLIQALVPTSLRTPLRRSFGFLAGVRLYTSDSKSLILQSAATPLAARSDGPTADTSWSFKSLL